MIEEFGEDGVLIVSNTAGAAGEEEQVLIPLMRSLLSSGENTTKDIRSTSPTAFHKGISPWQYVSDRRNLVVINQLWTTS